jgi:hypothetical protein
MFEPVCKTGPANWTRGVGMNDGGNRRRTYLGFYQARGATSGIPLPALMALLGVVADTHSEPERCGNQVGVIWFRTRMLHTQRARICRLMISEPALRPCKNRFSRSMDCPILRNTRVPKDAEALLHANVLKARMRARAESRSAHTGQLRSSARTVRMQILLYNRKLSARVRGFSSVNPLNGRK